MKTLLIMRHGKSDWSDPLLADHERPLAPRGRAAADRMGVFLGGNDRAPGLVISSPAVRARTTAERAIEAGGWDAPLITRTGLYGGDEEAVLVTIAEEAADRATVMVVGHEPVWSSLTARLTGGGQLRFPTAAVAAVELAIDRWSDIAGAEGVLAWFVIPRLLR